MTDVMLISLAAAPVAATRFPSASLCESQDAVLCVDRRDKI